jgi:hypothetical protein
MGSHRFVSICTAMAFAALGLAFGSNAAVASPIDIVFTIDPSQSTVAWSGADNTYGAYTAQPGGSLSTQVSGNFVIAFDPTTDNPATIQFVGNNSGNNNAYYQASNSDANAVPVGGPANLAGTTAGGQVQFALQNLIFSLNSGTINAATTSGLTETFSATSSTPPTGYTVTAGGIVFQTPNGVNGSNTDYVGSTGNLTTGTFTLSETGPGSGQWTLGIHGTVTYTYNDGTTTGTLTATGNQFATATYSANNQTGVTTASSGTETVTVPGSTTNSTVTATLPQGTTAGTLSVQQVPGITSLTQAAVTAGQNNPVFALSTSDTSIGAPQIWTVQFTGNLEGGTATLTFDFDPSTIPVGTPLADLGIWHFNESLGQWQFLTGPINVYNGYDTITITTNSFSPFELGREPVGTPEPATIVLAAAGMLPLGCFFALRRKRLAASRA